MQVGVRYNDGKKRKVRGHDGEVLGALFEGRAGRLGVEPAKLRWLAVAGALLLATRVVGDR
eukprot:7677602-Lingulodinium_polyedra.AAC.1